MSGEMSGRQPGPAPSRLRELDLLRFLAALAVVSYHYTAYDSGAWGSRPTALFPHLSALTRYGYLGVDLFFVISGFVILGSLWGRGAPDFASARIVRLMPAYWCCVLLTALVVTLLPDGDGLAPGQVLANLTMLQEGLGIRSVDGVYWTLWVELHFYVLLGLVAWRGMTYRRCVAFLGLWFFCSVLTTYYRIPFVGAFLLPQWSPYFIAGMAHFLTHRFGSSRWLWGLVGLCWIVSLEHAVARVPAVSHNVGAPVHPYAAAGGITGIFLGMALVASGRLGWLRWRGLTTLGALTYPLYLLHGRIGAVAIRELRPGLPRGAVLLIVGSGALGVAWLVHRCVERPVAGWLRRFLLRVRATIAAPAEDRQVSGDAPRHPVAELSDQK